jgi:macrolide-specific efflux system membrane fusion protein
VIAAGNSTANFDVQAAQKSVELAGVEVKRLQAQLEDGVLVAPFDGVITSTNGREGDLVTAYSPIAVVSDPSKLIVAIDLNAPDLPKAAIGQRATITTDAFKGQTFQSQVIALPSVAAGVSATNQVPGKPSVASTTVKLSFDPPGPVDLGSLANVTIVTQKHDDAIIVPIQAIKKAGGRTFVQVATGPGKKREVDVQVGIQTDQDVEILKGIKEGTPVITG